MIFRPGLVEIIFGFLFLVFVIVNLENPLLYVPIIFICFIAIITGIFELKGYNDRTPYLLVMAVILVILAILSYIQLSSNVDITLREYTIMTIVILLISIIVLFRLNQWNKSQKALDNYDKALAINPDNIIILNNKGVELTSQRKYEKALKCFNKVLELDPDDTSASNNKNFVEKYRKYHTLTDQLENDPKLEITENAGRLILTVKK